MKSVFTILMFIFIFMMPLTIVAQENFSFADLTDLQWLTGTWQRETSSGLSYESWQKVSDRTFEGYSYTRMEGEKKYQEFLRIEVYGNEIYYIARVSHNKYPIPFKLIESGNRFVFENSDHDFPQRIIYSSSGEHAMQARIEGVMNGKKQSVDFHFTKMNP
jgi:hypothetical protein